MALFLLSFVTCSLEHNLVLQIKVARAAGAFNNK
jgi:hypothetical protein